MRHVLLAFAATATAAALLLLVLSPSLSWDEKLGLRLVGVRTNVGVPLRPRI